MKVGDYEKFDEICGICRVKNEVNNESFYVVFANTDPSIFRELGDVVSKGKTRDEALKNAIKFFVKRQKKIEEDFCENENEDLKNVYNLLSEVKGKLNEIVLCNSEEVILPMQAWSWDGEEGFKDIEGVFWNASIRLNEDGKCEEFTP